jgi:hypothetical protein
VWEIAGCEMVRAVFWFASERWIFILVVLFQHER